MIVKVEVYGNSLHFGLELSSLFTSVTGGGRIWSPSHIKTFDKWFYLTSRHVLSQLYRADSERNLSGRSRRELLQTLAPNIFQEICIHFSRDWLFQQNDTDLTNIFDTKCHSGMKERLSDHKPSPTMCLLRIHW